MRTLHNEPLAPYTSLRVGGKAETLIIAENYEEAFQILKDTSDQLWLLGYGCNCLISDDGLPGTTLMLRGGAISVHENSVIADAGTWWDDVVLTAIEHGLWGLELLSGIPSSTGGAVFGNIAAYGAQVSDTLSWIDVYDRDSRQIQRMTASDIGFSYRSSSLQQQPRYVIMRVCFTLQDKPVQELRYESALQIASELHADLTTLQDRRIAILETRKRAGSLYDPNDQNPERTAGSFFKNPLVSRDQARDLAQYDETGKTLERLLEQNKIHGGSTERASAAHVLLAAGFQRGQQWHNVQLHPSHVLKIATLPGARANDVYTVVRTIQTTVQQKLAIELEPEVRFMGSFEPTEQ